MLVTRYLPPIPLSHNAVNTVLPTSNLGSGTDSKFLKAVLLIEKKLNNSRCRGVYESVGRKSYNVFFTFLLGFCSSMSIGSVLLIGFGIEDEPVLDLALSFLRADARIGVLLKMKLSWCEASTILSLGLVNFFLLNFFYFSGIVVDFFIIMI